MKMKQFYLSPSTEIIALNSEGLVCASYATIEGFTPVTGFAGYDSPTWD